MKQHRNSNNSTEFQDRNPIWRWLVTSQATGKTVAIVFVMNNFLTGFIFAGSELAQDHVIPIHLFDLLTGLSGALVLLALNPFFRSAENGSLRLWQVFTAWVISSIGAIVIPLTLERLISGQSLKPERIAGIPYALESYVAQFAAFSILVAGIIEMRGASMELAQARHKLFQIQENLSFELISQREKLDEQIKSRVTPVLEEIQAAVSNLASSSNDRTSKPIPQLKAAIESVVRPLSHELALGPITETEDHIYSEQTLTEIRKEISHMSFRDRWTLRIPLGCTFQPILSAIAFLMFAFPTFGFLDSITHALAVCIPAIVGIAGVTWALRITLSSIELPYLAANIIGVFFNGSLALVFLGAIFVLPNDLSPDVISGLTFGVGILLIVGGYFGLVIERRIRFLNLASEVNLEISSSLSRLRHEILVTRRKSGELLHGGVQAKLQAAILRLSRATSVDSKLVDEVLAEIEKAIGLLKNLDSPVSISLGELLDDLIDFWSGACRVEIQITREEDEIVSADSIATQCIIEVIRESISNAVKHDSAESVSVKLSVSGTKLVKTLVSHPVLGDKLLLKREIVSGYGSHVYDELTLDWSLIESEESIDMYATFPLNS
jgi:signal transduction histidine kinase